MNDPSGDTIVAVATPPGQGALAVIRLSGPGAVAITSCRFHGANDLATAAPRFACYGQIFDAKGSALDDVVATCFRAPASYSGEDVVEIACHGSPLIARQITESLAGAGARYAEPGEYTRRAFLNGKIDLAQAEAVGEVIASASAMALRGARSRLDGELSRHVGQLRQRLLELAALTELDLDFTEEDVPLVAPTALAERVDGVIDEIGEMLATFGVQRLLRDGVEVALVGAPNVGKSSLLNRLAHESRALVSDVPGTTRDAVHIDIEIDGVHFRVTDTAGLHESDDSVERMGMERTIRAAEDADIVVVVLECGANGSGGHKPVALPPLDEERVLVVANKSDLGPPPAGSELAVCALSGDGVDRLGRHMVDLSFGSNPYSEGTALIANDRQKTSLEHAHQRLGSAAVLARTGAQNFELVAAELRAAISGLGELLGEVTTDDVLDRIFAQFCIGK